MHLFEGSRSMRTKTLSFTSGKGGVGKTTVVTNMAVQLAQQGKRVAILDGDLGLANVDVMMGVRCEKNIYDVISGRCELSEILLEVTTGVFLIPGGSGIYELNQLSDFQKRSLMMQISELEMKFDYLLIDTASGIDANVVYLNSAAQEINLILTPEPASFTDAYSLIKVLHTQRRENRFSIICNQVRDEAEGASLFKRFSEVATYFLPVSLDYKGSIPADSAVQRSNKNREVLSLCNGRAPAAQAFRKICETYTSSKQFSEAKGGLQFFWQQMVGVV